MAEIDNGQNSGDQQQQSSGQQSGQQQSQQQAGQQQTQTAGGQQQQTPAEKTYSFRENRADWIPPTRLSEVTRARTQAEANAQKLQADLEAANKRIQALAGVTPQNPQEVEAQELRGIISKLFPKLGLLENLDEDTLNEVIEAAQVARQSSNATWERHTHGVLTSLDVAAAKVLGVPKLDEKVQGRIRRAFRDEGQRAESVRAQQMRQGVRESIETQQGDDDFIARFERGDDTLVQEFVSDYLNGFIEPVRRSVTARMTQQGRRPVPSGERQRMPIVQGQEKLNLNSKEDFKKALLSARGNSE